MSKLQKTDAILNIVTFVKTNWTAFVGGGGAMSFGVFDGFPATYVFLFCAIGILIGLMIRNALQPKQIQVVQEKVEEQKPIKLEEFVNRKFANETVLLDGKKLINCQFDGCTLQYNGGDFAFDSYIGEDCRIKLTTKQAQAALFLMRSFYSLHPQKKLIIFDQYGRKIEEPKVFVKK